MEAVRPLETSEYLTTTPSINPKCEHPMIFKSGQECRVLFNSSFSWVALPSLMIWVGHVARMVERRGVCGVLVGKPEGKRSL
jgi:hypothetical protein